MLEAEITPGGDVTVEGQHVGHLHGFQFVPDANAEGHEAKTLRNAAEKALAGEIEARAERFSAAADSALVLSHDGIVRWTGDPVAKLVPGDKLFEPGLRLIADEGLTGPHREKVETRLNAWLKAYVVRLLGPLTEIESAADLTGLARGIGYQVVEALGVLERAKVANEMRTLDQDGRANLRRHGIRFGAYHIFLPALLKPAPRTLAAQLWALRNGGLDQRGLDEIAHLAGSGRTSIKVDPEIAKGLYRAAGFRVCGERAVRVDILERLADLIRPAIAYRPGATPGEPPAGTADGDGFTATVNMTSLVGCSGEDFASILKSLGYVSEARPGPAITVPLVPAAATTPAAPAAPAQQTAGTGDVVSGEAEALGNEAADTAGTVSEPTEEVAAAPDDTAPETASAEPAPEPVVEAAPTAAAPEPRAEAEPPAAAEEPAADAAAPEPAAEPTIESPAPAALAADADGSAEAASAEPQALAEPDAPTEPEVVAEPDAPAEPETIEIWRLHRHQRPAGQRPNRGPRGDARQGEARTGEPRPDGGRRDGRRPDGGGRDDRNRRGGDRPDGRPRPEPRADGGPRRDGCGRPDRRPDQGHDEARKAEARPPRRERQPDPDSPFAKLAALKAQLETGDGGKR